MSDAPPQGRLMSVVGTLTVEEITMGSKVTDWMDALAAGGMTVEEVAQELRTEGLESPKRAQSMEESLGTDREFGEGGFDEVSRAYHLGQIDDGQYAVVAKAASGR